jgi:hypothetical protein
MSTQAQARLRIMKTLDAQPELTVILDASNSPSSRLRAKFLGQTGEDAIKLEVTTALGPGTIVSIAGELETPEGRIPVLGKFQVYSCLLAGIGKYHAHMSPHSAAQDAPPPQKPNHAAEDVNFYDILQVSRTADTDTIHRIFHVLAQRYHPDNRETGNEDRFRQIVEAHRVLSDRERRAAHDIWLISEEKTRLRIFDSLESTQGVQAEIRKRQGILRLLYTKRLTDPHQPALRGRDFAEMLGCPVEHLEFSLWVLRENKLIIRSDNNNFEITWQGVEAFEKDEANYGKKQRLTLPAPANA